MELRKLVITPIGGLGNRFLALGSALRMAEVKNFEVIVNWEAETILNHCELEFNALFKLHPYTRESIGDLSGYDLIDLTKESRILLDNGIFSGQNNVHIKANTVFFSDDSVSIDRSKVLVGNSIFYQDFMTEYRRYINSFPESDKISEILSRFDGIDFSNVVGIHIRRVANNDTTAFHLPFDNVPHEAYYTVMLRCMEKNPQTKFLICSNTDHCYNVFSSAFGSNAAINKDLLPKTSEHSSLDALIDMILLSRTRLIIRHYFTTFSYIAALRQHVPQVILASEGPSGPLTATFCEVRPNDAGQSSFFLSGAWSDLI